MNKLVSVIMPTYNREKTIVSSIMSVLNQTYFNFELIIVDDCSTDNSLHLIKNIIDSRIIVINLITNKGSCHARNIGIFNSKGDYICFIDSDDVWLPNKLDYQINLLNINYNNIDILLTNGYVYFNNKTKDMFDINKIKLGFLKTKDLLNRNQCSIITLIGKSECLKNIYFDENLPRLQDWSYVIKLSLEYRIYFDNSYLVNAYIQSDSITNKKKLKLIAIKIIYNLYKNEINKYIYIKLKFLLKIIKYYFN